MGVSLRVVGIFYDQSDIPFTQGMTVKSLLDEATHNPGGEANNFGYLSNTDVLTNGGMKESVTAFFANYPNGVTSKTSGTVYGAGEYFLTESMVGNPRYSVWQYYVFDASGTFQPNPMPLQSFATRKLNDGDKVIWRLVEILSAPNPVPTVYRSKLI